MIPKLRIARATNDLQKISEMYRRGLDLEHLGAFENHAGFDGVILGSPSCTYHFEFTQQSGHSAPRSQSPETLLVFYFSELTDWEQAQNRMKEAGFRLVSSHNPYWDQNGCTFEDLEGYRVVVCNRNWNQRS